MELHHMKVCTKLKINTFSKKFKTVLEVKFCFLRGKVTSYCVKEQFQLHNTSEIAIFQLFNFFSSQFLCQVVAM